MKLPLQTMVIPEEREGKTEDDPVLSRDTTPANDTVNSRKGGIQAPKQQKKVGTTHRERLGKEKKKKLMVA